MRRMDFNSTQKATNFKGSILRLGQYMKKHTFGLIIVVLFAIASSIFSIFGPKILGEATTAIYTGVMGKMTGESSGIDFRRVGEIIFVLIILYGFSSLFSYIQGFIMSGISMKVTYRMRSEIAHKINMMPLNYFDTTNHGEVLSRITNDVDTVSQTLTQSMSQLLTSATTVVGVLIMMLTINVYMTLAALCIIPVSLVIIMFIVKRSQKYFKSQQDHLGQVNGHVEEMYSGHLIVRAFNGEEKSYEEFSQYNEKLYKTAWRSQFLSGLMMPVMNIVSNFGYVAICVLGGALAARKAITVGDIQAFVQYVRNFTQPITQLANVANVLQQAAAASERVFEFLDEENEIPEVENPLDLEQVKGHVVFKNVCFGYTKDQTIIHDFSCDIQPGQKIAIVGPTGAGKTTLIKLLMRFYDIRSGSILLDGEDIRRYSRHNLRDHFGMVLQDTWLYKDTIRENIRYGRLDATDYEVIQAAKAAHVDSFVHMLPGGYDMELNEEGNNVSQGQKQLLTIARAIISKPYLLILDEATSSIDTRTELQIQQAMNELMKNRTSFIIAHRLSTIKDADLILVMNQGDIVEQGTHQELLAKKGFYADLYNSQFEASQEAEV